MLRAYHAIRELICAVALARADPPRISFASALDTVRQPAGNRDAFPAHQILRASLLVTTSDKSKPRSSRNNPGMPSATPLPRQGRRPFILVMLPLPVIGQLQDRVEQLERPAGKDSAMSSRPPSSGSLYNGSTVAHV